MCICLVKRKELVHKGSFLKKQWGGEVPLTVSCKVRDYLA